MPSLSSLTATRPRTLRRMSRSVLTGGVLAAFVAAALVGVSPAGADTNPPANTPATVAADALGAPQTNGVVWDVVVTGNIAFATGNFTSPRSHMLAFDVRTGALLSFSHTFDGQGLVLAASPDGGRIIVGGDFTHVDGQPRGHVALFATSDFSLRPYTPSFDNEVRAITVAKNNTAYFGGKFSSVTGKPRSRLAALDPSGAVLAWNASANADVLGLSLSPDETRVFAIGRFDLLSGATRLGLGPVDATTGAAPAWPSDYPIYDYGNDAAFYSISHDATNIYVTGYKYGGNEGNFEGRAGINPTTGAIVFIDDCHGDSYDTFPIGSVLYSASHSHDCATQSAFPETSPRTHHYALASTTFATHAIKPNKADGYSDFSTAGRAPQQLDWYPVFTEGTFTGQSQAVWCVSGNSQYVVYGGEFPTVNGVRQVGLTRFAVRSLAPNKFGPKSLGAPRLTAQGGGKVLVNYSTTWDPDNAILSYTIYRDNKVINTYPWETRLWVYGTTIAFNDSGVTPGQHTYKMTVSDGVGNVVTSGTTTVTAT